MTTEQTLGVYLIPDSGASVPQFSTQGSACFDICARLYTKTVTAYGLQNIKQELFTGGTEEGITLPRGWRVLIPTGIIFDIPMGFSVRLHARSGLALKEGLVLSNAEGVIDSDYTQELLVMVSAIGSPIVIQSGMRICQGELVENQPTKIEHLMYPPIQKTQRVGGFGSTGV